MDASFVSEQAQCRAVRFRGRDFQLMGNFVSHAVGLTAVHVPDVSTKANRPRISVRRSEIDRRIVGENILPRRTPPVHRLNMQLYDGRIVSDEIFLAKRVRLGLSGQKKKRRIRMDR